MRQIVRNEKRNAERELNKMLDKYLANPKYGTCPICGKKYNDYGNNAMPFTNGRCCKECDIKYVWPYRSEVMEENNVPYWEINEPFINVDQVADCVRMLKYI